MIIYKGTFEHVLKRHNTYACVYACGRLVSCVVRALNVLRNVHLNEGMTCITEPFLPHTSLRRGVARRGLGRQPLLPRHQVPRCCRTTSSPRTSSGSCSCSARATTTVGRPSGGRGGQLPSGRTRGRTNVPTCRGGELLCQ